MSNDTPPDCRPSTAELSCAVVVASFRPGELIDRCLHSLLVQQGVGRYEVVVVDSSADGTAERLRQDFPAVTVIGLDQQTHQSAARNIGVAHTRAPYIAITDQDCIVPPDWLARLLAHHQRGTYAIVGGAIGNGTPENAVGTASYLIEFNEFMPLGHARTVAMIPHCNICIRRDAFTTVGPFVAVPPGAEDQVYNFLLCQRGERLLFDPTIVVTHLNRTDYPSFLRHQRLLGVGSAIARRTVAIPGQAFVRHRVLACTLPMVRFLRTSGRLLRQDRATFLRYLRLSPILLPGYMMWTKGFLTGMQQRLPVVVANHEPSESSHSK
ncbi:MAG: glycosyltransferase [Deltaproteobacteria bacterium]|nr:glycosyltransferase [Deltaproteobacteria bacterium]